MYGSSGRFVVMGAGGAPIGAGDLSPIAPPNQSGADQTTLARAAELARISQTRDSDAVVGRMLDAQLSPLSSLGRRILGNLAIAQAGDARRIQAALARLDDADRARARTKKIIVVSAVGVTLIAAVVGGILLYRSAG